MRWRTALRKAETIKGLERGLRVLQALQAQPISSLHDLHMSTRISKPSLLRILNTLQQAGLISRRLADGYYRIAFCPEQERQDILARLRRSENPDDRLARDPKRLDRIRAETRQRGYGTRDPTFTGWQHGNPPRDDGLAAITVPLLDRGRVHGAINILWLKNAFTVEQFATMHLADLRTAANEIVSSLQTPTGRHR